MTDLTEFLLEGPKDQYSIVCCVCYSTSSEICLIKECKHYFCQFCIEQYLEYKILSGEILEITCPNCATPLEDSFIKKNTTKVTFQKYKAYRHLRFLEKNINLRWCPLKGCEGYSIGNVKNHKLSCNICNCVYCFYCGEEWHEGKKCVNKVNKDFEKWVASNNVKFCPLCKHRVLRDGGCTEMKCPFCQYSWCWNCGVDYRKHNDYNCMFGKSMFELYWTTILMFILTPILTPFAYFCYTLVKYEIYQQKYNQVKIWVKVLVYSAIFLISPLLLVIIVFGYSIILSIQLISEHIHHNLYVICLLLGLIVGTSLAVFLFAIAGVLCVLLPPAGTIFLLIKTYCVLKRRCRYEKKWEYYPRTVV